MGTNVVEGHIASTSGQSQKKWYQLLHNIAIYVPTHPVSYQRRKKSVHVAFALNQVK
jgi:hypothetical protein